MSDSLQNKPIPYDQKLAEAPDLTWLPWVGKNYADLPSDRKVLIVGESHYLGNNSKKEVEADIKGHHNDPTVTREAVVNGMIKGKWGNPTYSNLHTLLMPTGSQDHQELWGNVCFYNFIQRVMSSTTDRPTKTDFMNGWAAFLKVVEILQPSHCLFIGVSASNYFNLGMRAQGAEFTKAAKIEKIRSTYSRQSSITMNGLTTSIEFVEHTSARGFNSVLWHHYLQRQAPALMQAIPNPVAVEN